MRHKILFTSNIPVPYRVQFFNELGKYVDLTVTFERTTAKTRNSNWLSLKAENFKAVTLKGVSLGDDLAFCPSIIDVVQKGNYDLIVVGIYYSPTGILLTEYLKHKKIKYAFSGDGANIKKENWLKYKIKSRLQGGASLYLVSSNLSIDSLAHYGIEKSLIRKYPFSSLTTCDILPEPVNDELRLLLRKKLNIKEDYIIIGVGRYLFWKKWDVLIEATRKLKGSVGLYIVGGDPRGTYLEKFVSDGYNYVHFVNFKQKDELSEYYMASDVFVLPSSHDVWGLVVNEAMAKGLPVISTPKTTAAVELIESGINGYITPVGDVVALSSALEKLQGNKDLRFSMSVANLKKIKNYTIENMAITTASIISDFLKE